MKHFGSIALLLAAPLAGMAQTAVFTDNFGNGSTFNGVSTPVVLATVMIMWT